MPNTFWRKYIGHCRRSLRLCNSPISITHTSTENDKRCFDSQQKDGEVYSHLAMENTYQQTNNVILHQDPIGFKNEEYLIVSFLAEKHRLYGCKVPALLLARPLSGSHDHLKGNSILTFKFPAAVRTDLTALMP